MIYQWYGLWDLRILYTYESYDVCWAYCVVDIIWVWWFISMLVYCMGSCVWAAVCVRHSCTSCSKSQDNELCSLQAKLVSCIPSSADELYKLVLCMPLAPYIIDKLCLSIYSGLYKPEYSICMCLIRHIHIHRYVCIYIHIYTYLVYRLDKYIQIYRSVYILRILRIRSIIVWYIPNYIYSGLYKPEYSICMCLIRHIHIHTWSTTKYIQLYQLYYIGIGCTRHEACSAVLYIRHEA